MWLDRLKTLYDEYIGQVRQLERDRKPADGLLGMGKGPSDDACHDRFAEAVENFLCEFDSSVPSSDEVKEVLGYIYGSTEAENTPLSAYWMLGAVHGFTAGLIDRLQPQQASELAELYERVVPRRKRLPVQKKVWTALRRAER